MIGGPLQAVQNRNLWLAEDILEQAYLNHCFVVQFSCMARATAMFAATPITSCNTNYSCMIIYDSITLWGVDLCIALYSTGQPHTGELLPSNEGEHNTKTSPQTIKRRRAKVWVASLAIFTVLAPAHF